MVNPFGTLMEHKGYGAIIFDDHLHTIEVNSAAEHLLKLSVKPESRVPITDIFPELIGIEETLAHIVAKKEKI